MKAILHFGMPKTGTSSIQETFFKRKSEEFAYVDWRSANHGGLMQLLFSDGAHNHAAFRWHPNAKEETIRLKAEWLGRLRRFMSECQCKTVLFSAEAGFSAAPVIKERLREHFQIYTDDIRVLVYIRPPVSFLESAFQQNVKAGTGSLEISRIWPRYKEKIQELDSIFGTGNVELVKFERSSLYCGDVVKDFAKRVGEEVSDDEIVRTNDRISLEAMSLIYFWRTQMSSEGKLGACTPKAERALISRLSRAGETKFALSNATVAPIIKENLQDVLWMERRLGDSLIEQRSQDEFAIDSAQDLLRVAERCEAYLRELIVSEIESVELSGVERMKQLVECLSVWCR